MITKWYHRLGCFLHGHTYVIYNLVYSQGIYSLQCRRCDLKVAVKAL